MSASEPVKGEGNPFEIDVNEMRELGYHVVDCLIERLLSAREIPPVRMHQDEEKLEALRKPFGEQPQHARQVIDAALEQVFGNTMNLMHPRFYAYMPAPGNYISTLADFMASGFNVFAGTALHNQGAFEVEQQTIDWLGTQFGWDFPSSGLFVSGGSAANMTALAIARHVKLNGINDRAVVYCSTQTHSCIERSMILLGFKPDQLRLIEPDDCFRIEATSLEQAIHEDLAAGLRPFCVVANGGTTNTGAVDPLPAIADVCERHDLWFHIDAAYGGGAILSREGRSIFAGAEHAHTIAIDPHKWMFQPFECACLLGRKQHWFQDTFRRLPAYMRDTDVTGELFNYRDMGAQVTRSFKAFKLWLSLQVYGVDCFRKAVDDGLELARYAQRRVDSMAEWEVITPATLGVITCRFVGTANPDEADGINQQLAHRLNATHTAYITTTELNGMTVLRMCPIHPAATTEDIDQTFDLLEEFAGSMESVLGDR